MCGICGIVGQVERPVLERMTALLTHRGPDDEGIHIGPGIGIGVRRLSIIDVAGGHQPAYNETGSLCVAQNGEIYNYKELMNFLKGKGHVFKSCSDTEVIVHAYEEWGQDFCCEFNGDFAIAVWDRDRAELLLARDRFGVHPIYYFETGGELIFSSEIKSLLAHPRAPREIDPAAVDQYLTLRYVPEGRTLFRGIRKLPCASTMRFRDRNSKVRYYWALPDPPENSSAPDFDSAAEELLAILTDSVRLRMRSNMPVGAYLSGGLDSSAVVGIMSRFTPQPVKTFSIGFGSEIDELNQARALAKRFGTDHHEILVGKQDFELLPRIVWHLDEPIGDAIIIPIYRLAQEASKDVKVVLSGEGADEVWAGYIHHLAMHQGGRVRSIVPGAILQGLRKLLRLAPLPWMNAVFPYPAALGNRGRDILGEYLGMLAGGILSQEYQALASVFRPKDKAELYTDAFSNSLANGRKHFATLDVPGGSRLQRLLRFDLDHWLPDYTLLKQDKLGLGNSLEVRVPYLDHRLVEFAARLPDAFKIRGSTNKRLLRRAAASVVPPGTAYAPKKAFYIPTEKVFGPEFDGWVRDILGSRACRERGILSQTYLDRRLSGIRSTELIENKQIVALAILELWFQTFADSNGQSPATALHS